MKIVIHSTKQIVSVIAEDFQECLQLEYREYKKGNWFKSPQKEGFYSPFDFQTIPFSTEDLESGELYGIDFKIKDKKIYFKPYCQIRFTDNSQTNKVFETYEEAKEFALESVKDLEGCSIIEK